MNPKLDSEMSEDYIQELIDQKRLELHGITPEEAHDERNWIKPNKEVKRAEKHHFSSDTKFLANSRGCLPYKEKYL